MKRSENPKYIHLSNFSSAITILCKKKNWSQQVAFAPIRNKTFAK